MRDQFNLTPVPVTLAMAAKMALSQAIDTSDYDIVVATASIVSLVGTSPNYTLRLIGSMSKDSEDGWVELATFGPASTTTTLVLRGDKLLKYLRWELVLNSGSLTSITFTVQGFLSEN